MSQYLDKDGASRIAENFLSKQAEQDAALRNLQFDLKEAEHALVKTVQGSPPLNIRALSRPLDDYLISGNTVQNGTPTPDDPIFPQECGDRTENLFDGYLELGSFNAAAGSDYPSTNGCRTHYIDVTQNKVYTASVPIDCFVRFVGFYGNNKAFLGYKSNTSEKKEVYTFDTPYSTKTIRIVFSYKNDSSIIVSEFPSDKIMLNEGSTALPYEPYGYKIPITCGGETKTVYLDEPLRKIGDYADEVKSDGTAVRKIKKIVLDGTENWQALWGVLCCILSTAADTTWKATTVMCDRYNAKGNLLQAQGYPSHYGDCSITFRDYQSSLLIRDDRYGTDTAAYKSYLADQYAAGTPVTIWYVLATPETGIVAGVTLTTTKGFNTITTDTTVLPSIIEVKGVINNA